MTSFKTKEYFVKSLGLSNGVRVIDRETGEIVKEDKDLTFEFVNSDITGEHHLEVNYKGEKHNYFYYENPLEILGEVTGDDFWYEIIDGSCFEEKQETVVEKLEEVESQLDNMLDNIRYLIRNAKDTSTADELWDFLTDCNGIQEELNNIDWIKSNIEDAINEADDELENEKDWENEDKLEVDDEE